MNKEINNNKVPIPADSQRKAPLSGDHAMYVIAKNAAVDMINHYYETYGIKRFILRLSRVYMYNPNPYINGSREIIIEGENGTIIPTKDENALYDAMFRMINDKEKCMQMAKNSRSMIANRYERGFVQKCLLDFYDEIIAG